MSIKRQHNQRIFDDMAEKLVILEVIAVFFMRSVMLACII